MVLIGQEVGGLYNGFKCEILGIVFHLATEGLVIDRVLFRLNYKILLEGEMFFIYRFCFGEF